MYITKKELESIIEESKNRIESNKRGILSILELTDDLTAEEFNNRFDFEYRNLVSDLMFGVYGVLRQAENWQVISGRWLDELEEKYNIYDFER